MAQRGRHSQSLGRHSRSFDESSAAKKRRPSHARQPGAPSSAGFTSQMPASRQAAPQAQAAAQQRRQSAQQPGAPASRTGYAEPRSAYAAPQRPRQQAAPVPGQGTTYYSRDNYGSDATGRHVRPLPKRSSTRKRIAIAVACVLGALVLAGGAFALWFTLSLNSALAPSDEASEQLNDLLVDVPLDEPFYMLLLGSDSREGSGTSANPTESGDQQRSDVIILARIDASEKKVTLISVPRDTPYTLDDGTVIKVNEAYNLGGAPMSVKAVSEITGADISHYAEVHLSGLESIVDLLGGVEVYVDRRLSVSNTLTGEEVPIEEGLQTLSGKEAQVFVRDRHAYEDAEEGQDNRRQSNVRTLLEAIVKKVLQKPLPELPGTILELAQYVTTDLKTGDFVTLAMAFSGDDVTMYSCTGPSDGDIAEAYGVWFCYPNPEGWAELIRQADEGIEPQGIDFAATQQTL